MTETHPPRFAEAVLESFGADEAFSDAVLGDLSQEFALRVDRYGERAARMWYHRQALATAPHLLRRWWSKARFADFRRLVNVLGLAYVLTMMIELGVSFVVVAFISPLIEGPTIFARPAGQIPLVLAASLLGPMCAGYLAAGFERERPMLAATALAVAWPGVMILGAIISAFLLPPTMVSPYAQPWTRLVIIPLIVAGSLIGGALRTRSLSKTLNVHQAAAKS